MTPNASLGSPSIRFAEESGDSNLFPRKLQILSLTNYYLDVPTILSIIRELAEYEHASDAVLATEESLKKTLSFPSDPSKGYAKTLLLFAPNDSVPSGLNVNTPQCAGMALYFHNYSTWRAAPGIYLEDLFVRRPYRKRGYGKLLLQELARETTRVGGTRLEWSVLKWNKPSLDFYESMGAKAMDEWVGMRVDFDALDKMAEGKSLLQN